MSCNIWGREQQYIVGALWHVCPFRAVFYLHVGTMFCCMTMGYKIKQCKTCLCVVLSCMPYGRCV